MSELTSRNVLATVDKWPCRGHSTDWEGSVSVTATTNSFQVSPHLDLREELRSLRILPPLQCATQLQPCHISLCTGRTCHMLRVPP